MDRYISRILTASLFVIPLCGSLVIGPVIGIHDPMAAKEFLIVLSILSMGILALLKRECYFCNIKTLINWPLYALIIFLPLSIYCSPPFKLQYYNVNMGGLWMWKSLTWVFLYWILYETLIRVDFNKKAVIKAICGAALITVVYACIQIIGLDQFQFVRHVKVIGSPAAQHITGMIGCPTYLAIWLVMCLPFILAYTRWPWWILTGSVIVVCKSDIGIGGLVLILLLWQAFRARKRRYLVLLGMVSLFIIIAVAVNWRVIRPKISDNGRFEVWEATFKDWKAPAVLMAVRDDMTDRQKIEIQNLNKRTYALTGRGMGSFPYFFGFKYMSRYDKAHNDHLEIPYSIGLIGYILFMAAIGFVMWITFLPAKEDLFLSACYISFLYSVIAAFGIPLWQHEPLRYFSAMTFIFLSSCKK